MTGEDAEAFMLDVSPQLGAELLAVVLTERIEDTARRLLTEHPKRDLRLSEIIHLVSTEVVDLAREQGMGDQFCDSLAATVTDCALAWFARLSALNN